MNRFDNFPGKGRRIPLSLKKKKKNYLMQLILKTVDILSTFGGILVFPYSDFPDFLRSFIIIIKA